MHICLYTIYGEPVKPFGRLPVAHHSDKLPAISHNFLEVLACLRIGQLQAQFVVYGCRAHAVDFGKRDITVSR